MDFRIVGHLLLCLVGLSLQTSCDQCDCVVSGDQESRGVHVATIQCHEGSITWYNPTGALRVEINPENLRHFQTCFKILSGDVKLKVSQEADMSINSKSPSARSKYVLNDSNLKTLITTTGTSQEYCLTSAEPVILYLEPEVTGHLGYQKVVFLHDTTRAPDHTQSSIEECRPCSEEETLKAYCSSDFVIVGSMASVRQDDEHDKTQIEVTVSQIIRQKGSHFTRTRRHSPTLDGTITAPRKCGVIKGDGQFLMTGRLRLGELKMGCAPYLDEWETLVNRAELEGRMECTRD